MNKQNIQVGDKVIAQVSSMKGAEGTVVEILENNVLPVVVEFEGKNFPMDFKFWEVLKVGEDQ